MSSTDPNDESNFRFAEPLRRRWDRRILGGVAGGLADYIGVDVALVRMGFVVLGLLGGVGVPAYLAAWVLIPDEGASESVAERWLYRHEPPPGQPLAGQEEDQKETEGTVAR
jgi:phage shock protein C